MCPSGKCFVHRSRGENFRGAARARRGRCWRVCASEDWWNGPEGSRDSILPFMERTAGREVWEVEISRGDCAVRMCAGRRDSFRDVRLGRVRLHVESRHHNNQHELQPHRYGDFRNGLTSIQCERHRALVAFNRVDGLGRSSWNCSSGSQTARESCQVKTVHGFSIPCLRNTSCSWSCGNAGMVQ